MLRFYAIAVAILIIALGVIFISPKWLLLILALSVIIGIGFLIIAYLINKISKKNGSN